MIIMNAAYAFNGSTCILPVVDAVDKRHVPCADNCRRYAREETQEEARFPDAIVFVQEEREVVWHAAGRNVLLARTIFLPTDSAYHFMSCSLLWPTKLYRSFRPMRSSAFV
jgi:hypothetical protein